MFDGGRNSIREFDIFLVGVCEMIVLEASFALHGNKYFYHHLLYLSKLSLIHFLTTFKSGITLSFK